MTASADTLAPGVASPAAPGPGAPAESEALAGVRAGFDLARTLDDTMGRDRYGNPTSRGLALRAIIEHAHREDLFGWLAHVRSAAGCSNPIRLQGTLDRVDRATGTVLSRQSTADMPDGVIYKACGNRRDAVCPHCAEVYRRDAFQLIRAGMIGGKGVDMCVSARPAVFATFTADTFGLVHTRATGKAGQVKPCHPRRNPEVCPHGITLSCNVVHAEGDKVLGTALCPDCYDYEHQVVWNNQARELWRRTIGVGVKRYLDKLTRRVGTIDVKANCCKVAEFQARGVVHYHAVFRLDGIDPDTGAYIDPPAELDVIDLADAIRYAVKGTAFTTAPHPRAPEGWRIRWGQHPNNPDVRPIQLRADAEITDSLVAGYLAKYATKSTEATGHTSRRLTPDTIDLYTGHDPRLKRPHGPTHAERLVDACWQLGAHPAWRNLRAWAHMLGYGGHFLTKTRGYSITFTLLRDRRIIWRRTAETEQAADTDGETTLIVGSLSYAGTGWRTLGDAALANASAARAREEQRTAREELAHEAGTSR